MNHITNLISEINNSPSITEKLQQENRTQLIQIMESDISFENIPWYEILKDHFTKLWMHLKYEDMKHLWKTTLICWWTIEKKSNLVKSIKNELCKISWKEFIWIQMNIDNFHKNKFEEINKVLTNIAELFDVLEKEYDWYIVLYINNIEQLWKLYYYHEEIDNYECMKITLELLYELLDNRARKFVVIWQVNDFSELDCYLSSKFCNKYNIGTEKISNFFIEASKYTQKKILVNIKKSNS